MRILLWLMLFLVFPVIMSLVWTSIVQWYDE